MNKELEQEIKREQLEYDAWLEEQADKEELDEMIDIDRIETENEYMRTMFL